MRGENFRFFFPISLLCVFWIYTSQKLIRAHVNPDVDDISYTIDLSLPARRGTIYDTFGKECPLAKSVPVWEYRLDPVSLTNRVVKRKGEPRRPPEAIVKTIANTLKIDYQKVLDMARSGKHSGWRNQYLATSSEPETYRILSDSSLVSGVKIENRQVRQYLHRRSLSHVIGSVNAQDVGSAGIELRYNKVLTGVPGRILGMKDALGRELYDKRMVSIVPVPGADVYLTIDHNIQYEAETALADGMKEFGAAAGWCLVMDSRTGAILALASRPDFDPVRFGSTPEAAKINRVCNFTYEPGSVMKVITAASAIDAGLVTPDSTYSTNRDDDRYYRLPGDGRHVWEPRMTIRDAIVHSSNIVIGKLGSDLGPKRLWSYMRAFGFGSRTGIELPGEESGILPHYEKWDRVKWSRAPIGQGIAVTALQLASAYQAIANDGLRMRPYIVQKVVSANGVELQHIEPEALGRPISVETAQKMRDVMVGVASPKGTARRAAIRGYSVAGKTGTAQKVVNRRYSDHLFYATFCGIVPASEPRLVVLVTLDFEERRRFHQGGNSAGPIFRRLATAALRYLMIQPDRPEELSEFGNDDEFDRIMSERAEKYGIISDQ